MFRKGDWEACLQMKPPAQSGHKVNDSTKGASESEGGNIKTTIPLSPLPRTRMLWEWLMILFCIPRRQGLSPHLMRSRLVQPCWNEWQTGTNNGSGGSIRT
mmetsp:Transcript_43715/g.92930  ORF Transcript_43715/g.92930 Transcript_43715/m.92930 type:complete len:101 (+) Transcript_43715:596-898(+)